MANIHRTFDTDSFLPEGLGAAIRRRIREITGFALIVVAALAACALATWSIKDPSWSYATNAAVHNVLGITGAIAADLLTQLFGLAAVALIIPIAAWGWRLLAHRKFDRPRVRIAMWLVGTLLAAAFASSLPRTAAWPLPTGLGGAIGDALLRGPAALNGAPITGVNRLLLTLALAASTFSTMVIATGTGLHERSSDDDTEEEGADVDEDEETSISIGWFVHTFMSLKARFLRLLLARISRVASSRAKRVEPRMEGELSASEVEGDKSDVGEDARGSPQVSQPAPRVVPISAAAKRKSADGYELPSLGLLATPRSGDRAAPNEDVIKANAVALESVLEDFGVRGEIINAHPGPVVTLYELEPAPGIKSSRVIGLADDIARSMSALSARVAVVAGRNVIGIELPNPSREKVYLRELLGSEDYVSTTAKLPLCLGKTIGGHPVIVDLTRMPHLLIAGTTGSGKSVAINTMILSLVYRLGP
ncbi:MAG: DNA translocase FtsK, partial [Bradyrhizobiaceae bacterium]|nr:DNA translocase FtsK [Bradyrhizobiaceae bacterium]